MVAPGIYAVARTPAPAASKLGAVAQELAAQTTVTTLSIAATSGYVYGLTQTASPFTPTWIDDCTTIEKYRTARGNVNRGSTPRDTSGFRPRFCRFQSTDNARL